MRYRTRSDANQKAIDCALRKAGATVVPLGNVGNGCPDRLVGFAGETYLIETKNKETGRGRSIASRENHMRTPEQTRFHAEWQGKPVAVAYTIHDALQVIGVV